MVSEAGYSVSRLCYEPYPRPTIAFERTWNGIAPVVLTCVRLWPRGRDNDLRLCLPALRAPTAGRAAGRVSPAFYLTTSSSFAPSSPNNVRKRNVGHSDSIRSRGLGSDHEFNLRWLTEARRILKPDATLWVTGTHHIVFGLGFALQSLGFRILNDLIWFKPNATPNALHTTFKHSQQTRAERSGGSSR